MRIKAPTNALATVCFSNNANRLAMYMFGLLSVRDTLSMVCQEERCTLRQQIQQTDAGDQVLNWPGPSVGYADPLRPDQVEALERLDLTLDQYRSLLQRVFTEVYRVLVNGGRVCINVANLGRKPYIPLHSYIIHDMLAAGFHMRGEVIWNKGSSAGTSTAWGSWQSASNPTLRDVHEYILVLSKGEFSRKSVGKKSTISKSQFLQYTKSIWDFPAESAKKVGHPAPFPVELPYRCIQLYTFAGDVVLDPFCGLGTTCVAAMLTGRHFVGYETNEQYVKAAEKRIDAFRQKGNM